MFPILKRMDAAELARQLRWWENPTWKQKAQPLSPLDLDVLDRRQPELAERIVATIQVVAQQTQRDRSLPKALG